MAEDELLAEQISYYRTIAPVYGAGRLDEPGGAELDELFDTYPPEGDALELACGPGTWTPDLRARARSLTALDASPEMLAIAASKVPAGSVEFVCADVFAWSPPRAYDFVFFGFWLSHVPLARFEEFFALVGRCLAPGGRVLFIDDGHRTPGELIEGPESELIERRAPGDARFRIVKVPHLPGALETRLRGLGWDIAVHATAGPFFYGYGGRAGEG